VARGKARDRGNLQGGPGRLKNLNPFQTARRDSRRRARFGQKPQACIRCGYPDLVALIPGTREQLEAKGVPHTLFEEDHIVGRVHDPKFVFAICRNCHAVVTDERVRAAISMLPEPDPNVREVLRLEALALFEEKLAEALRRWAVECRTLQDESEALKLEDLASPHEKSAADLYRWASEKREGYRND